jgi:hypothetical protein
VTLCAGLPFYPSYRKRILITLLLSSVGAACAPNRHDNF